MNFPKKTRIWATLFLIRFFEMVILEFNEIEKKGKR